VESLIFVANFPLVYQYRFFRSRSLFGGGRHYYY